MYVLIYAYSYGLEAMSARVIFGLRYAYGCSWILGTDYNLSRLYEMVTAFVLQLLFMKKVLGMLSRIK